MHVFYHPNFHPEGGILTDKEAHHALQVLRLKTGDEFEVTSGTGIYGTARIAGVMGKKCAFEWVSHTEFQPRAYPLHMALSPLKNGDRLEWFLEKATEIGVDEISLLICNRSERRKVNMERLNKRLTAAIKQSQRPFLPRLNAPVSLDQFLSKPLTGNGFIAHCDEGQKNSIHHVYQPGEPATILIGPEGDFDPGEIKKCLNTGFLPVLMGSTRLRSETAALYACTAFNLMNDEA